MADDTRDIKSEAVDTALNDMKLEEGASPVKNGSTLNGTYEQAPTPGSQEKSRSSTPPIGDWDPRSQSKSPVKKQSATPSPKSEEDEEIIGGDITVTVEDGKPPKLSRKASQKVVSRPAPLYDHLSDSTEEAVSTFTLIRDSIGQKGYGLSEHDSLDCDCSEEWSK